MGDLPPLRFTQPPPGSFLGAFSLQPSALARSSSVVVDSIPSTLANTIPQTLSDLLSHGPTTNKADWLHASALLVALMRMGLQSSFTLSGSGLQDLDPASQTHINAV